MHKPIPPHARASVALGLVIALGGCVAVPAAALLQALPGTDKTMSAFQSDQTVCKQFAQQSISGQVDNTNLQNAGTAALTTLLGTGLGAVGGGGLVAMTSAHDQGATQQQYDNAYAQCMSSKGNAVPGGPAATPQPATPQAVTAPAPSRAASVRPG